MIQEKLSYRETEKQFELPHMRAAAWERIYLEEGLEGFLVERRGRNSAGRPRQLPKEVEEDLLAEVQRLRAENDYLKNCKPWFWKKSNASRKNAGSSRTKATALIGNFAFNRSISSCIFLLPSEANEQE